MLFLQYRAEKFSEGLKWESFALDPKSWVKTPEPVFTTSEENGQYDPNRHARVQVIHWNEDGTPNFGVPRPDTK